MTLRIWTLFTQCESMKFYAVISTEISFEVFHILSKYMTAF